MKPTLEDVVNKAVDGALARARVMLPGRIESYDSTTMRASVLPLVMDLLEAETGGLEGVPIPVLTDVPVKFPGSGGVRVKFPVSVGDVCELVFASSSIARLKVLGSAGGPLHPGDPRHHALPDCVAHLGLQFRAEDADTLIEFTTDDKIRCGGDQPLVTRAEFMSHTHPDPSSGFTGTPVDVITGTPKLRG